MIDAALVLRWQRAYEAANGKPAPEIRYGNGWYRYGPNFFTPFRRWKLERICEALEERAGIMLPPLGTTIHNSGKMREK